MIEINGAAVSHRDARDGQEITAPSLPLDFEAAGTGLKETVAPLRPVLRILGPFVGPQRIEVSGAR